MTTGHSDGPEDSPNLHTLLPLLLLVDPRLLKLLQVQPANPNSQRLLSRGVFLAVASLQLALMLITTLRKLPQRSMTQQISSVILRHPSSPLRQDSLCLLTRMTP